jgi:hypothetical protein
MAAGKPTENMGAKYQKSEVGGQRSEVGVGGRRSEVGNQRSDMETKREKYLKTDHGKMFLRNRLKSYLTG